MGLRLEALDTNLIMRAILNDCPAQTEKVFDLLTTPASIFYVPDLAITEVVYNLAGEYYKWDRETIVNALLGFLKTPRVDYNESVFNRVFELYLKHPKLSFNDCYLAAYVADREKTPIWTFDKAFAKQCEEAELLD